MVGEGGEVDSEDQEPEPSDDLTVPGTFPNSPFVAKAPVRVSSQGAPATSEDLRIVLAGTPKQTFESGSVVSLSSPVAWVLEDSEIFETSDRDGLGSPFLDDEPKGDLAATEVTFGVEGIEDEVEVGEDTIMAEEASPGNEQDAHPFDGLEEDTASAAEDENEGAADDQAEGNTGEQDEEEGDPEGKEDEEDDEDQEDEEDPLTRRGSKGKGRRILVDTESLDSSTLKVLTFLILRKPLDLF